MGSESKIQLTASEIATLWLAYQSLSMTCCFLSYFEKTTEDEEISSLIGESLSLGIKQLNHLKDIHIRESMALPIGFSEADVDLTAPKLYSDAFALVYKQFVSETSIIMMTASLTKVARPDIRTFFHSLINDSMRMHDAAVALMVKKGIHVSPPHISIPEKAEMLEKESFLTGFLGRRRPLTAVEIMNVYSNLERNAYGRTLITGFAQVAKDADVRDYLWRGKEIATKHVKEFTDLLIENDLTAPMVADVNISKSTTSPFSDKMMMCMVSTLSGYSLNNYSAGAGMSMRRDVATLFLRLAGEVGAYAEDGVEMTLKYGWLEQPPTANDRRELARV